MSPTSRSPRAHRVGASFAALALAALSFAPAPAHAPAANERPVRGEGIQERHPEASEAIQQLKSPYCPGFMLEVCSSSQGAALRDSLQMLAEEGWSSDEIVEWVLANHGEEYRALPKRTGASLLLAWVVPPLGVFVGFAAAIVALRRMRASRPPRAVPEGDLSPEDEERLRQAMREVDAEEEATFF